MIYMILLQELIKKIKLMNLFWQQRQQGLQMMEKKLVLAHMIQNSGVIQDLKIWLQIKQEDLNILLGITQSDILVLKHIQLFQKQTDQFKIRQQQEVNFTGLQIKHLKKEKIKVQSELTLKVKILQAMKNRFQVLVNTYKLIMCLHLTNKLIYMIILNNLVKFRNALQIIKGAQLTVQVLVNTYLKIFELNLNQKLELQVPHRLKQLLETILVYIKDSLGFQALKNMLKTQ